MKKLALFISLAFISYSINAQQWPVSGWPYTVTTGSFWNSPILTGPGSADFSFYNYQTNGMINDLLTSTNNFYNSPPLDPFRFGGYNQKQYWSIIAKPLCTKIITEELEYAIADGDPNRFNLGYVHSTIYNNDNNRSDRQEAISQIIGKIMSELNLKGIGMEMIESIFVSASDGGKDKYNKLTKLKIRYSYIIAVPCPNESGQN